MSRFHAFNSIKTKQTNYIAINYENPNASRLSLIQLKANVFCSPLAPSVVADVRSISADKVATAHHSD